MKLVCLFVTFYSVSLFAIDDASFANKDRYVLLNFKPITSSAKFSVTANCFPPKGKKLNPSSVIKVWEKINNEWVNVDHVNPSEHLGFSSSYEMSKDIVTRQINSEIALEIDFIHCNISGGGQCAMEKYLGKIHRSNKEKNTHLVFDLKI